MADVRLAVADYPAMVRLLHAAEEEIATAPREGEPVAAAAFLRWMADENFVLIGHRRLDIGERGALAVAAGENLGLLRDPAVPVFDALRDTAALMPAMRAALVAPVPLTVAKANMRSTVHRPQHADVVATRLSTRTGACRACGSSSACSRRRPTTATRAPSRCCRRRCTACWPLAGFDPDAHDGRALRNILDTWPRDELFQAPEAAILAGRARALDLQIRPRPALSVRRDPFGRFVSAIAWLPREGFDTRLRERVGEMLARPMAGASARSTSRSATRRSPASSTSSGPTRRAGREVDEAVLEAAVAQAARCFRERLGEALTVERGEATAAALLWPLARRLPARLPREPPPARRARPTSRWRSGRWPKGGPPPPCRARRGRSGALSLRLVNPGGPLPLADALPLFESLGLRAVEEMPYRLSPEERATAAMLHVFALGPRGAGERARRSARP